MDVWETWPPRCILRFYFFAHRERERERFDRLSCHMSLDRPRWLDHTPDDIAERRGSVDDGYARQKAYFRQRQQMKEDEPHGPE